MTIDVNSAGTLAKWNITITCPKGEAYTLYALAADLGTDAPHDDGGDRGVRATTTVTGTCTGKAQRLKLVLETQPELICDECGEPIFWPLSEHGGYANIYGELTGDSFRIFQCAHEACASKTVEKPIFK
jgi:hypothetical protein